MVRRSEAGSKHRGSWGGAKLWLLAIVAVVFLGTGLSILSVRKESERSASAQAAAADAGTGPAEMTENERLEYVAKFVTIEGLAIGPDTKPGSTDPVPGLLKATGTVINGGARHVARVSLRINTLGEGDAVLGSYLENVASKKGLAPGERREFKFEIPEKPGYTGRFQHLVQ